MRSSIIPIIVLLLWWCGTGIALASQMTLIWINPTTNADGSPLTDLAGIVVYWRADPLLPWEDIGEVAATVTSVVVQPVFVGEYTVRARNIPGRESANSNLVTVTRRPRPATIYDAIIYPHEEQ